jgi:hypothetical protein
MHPVNFGVLHLQGSKTGCTLGSILHAARCKAVASQPRSRASRRLLAGRAGTTGAPGKALRLSLFTMLMTAQAIINENSIVIFFSSKARSPELPNQFAAGGNPNIQRRNRRRSRFC